MDLRSLRHFVTLAQEGSFVSAAEALHLTQPALSRSIAALEQEMGVKLIERHRKGCTPTPAGELLLRDAAAILRQASTLQHTMHSYAKGELGHLRFGAAPLPHALVLPQLLGDMLREHTGITLSAVSGSLTSLMQQLLHDHIEFFLCAEVRLVRDTMIRTTPLFQAKLAWLARADHPLAHQSALTAADLAAYPLACVRSDFNPMQDGTPDILLDVPVTLGFDDYTIALAALPRCDAICLSSRALLPAHPGLVALDLAEDEIATGVNIVAVSRRGRAPSPLMAIALERIRTIARTLYAEPEF